MFNQPLPKGIYAHFTDAICSIDSLYNEEKSLTKEFESKRLQEFCQGRYCARQCLS